MEKKLDGNYIRMLRVILSKIWRQHPKKQQLYSHRPPITKTIQVWRTRHVGHCWRSRNELISDVLLWTPLHGQQKQDNQPEPTYNSSLPIRDVNPKTCRKQWTIGRGSKRGSEISVLMAAYKTLGNFKRYFCKKDSMPYMPLNMVVFVSFSLV